MFRAPDNPRRLPDRPYASSPSAPGGSLGTWGIGDCGPIFRMLRQRCVTDCIRLKRCTVTGTGSPARPVVAHRVAAVPIDRCLAHCIEDTSTGWCQLSHLDHGAGVALVQKIDERTAWGLPALAYPPTVLDGPVEPLVIILGPARPVLQALVPGREKLPVNARRRIALLDQLELNIAGIG